MSLMQPEVNNQSNAGQIPSPSPSPAIQQAFQSSAPHPSNPNQPVDPNTIKNLGKPKAKPNNLLITVLLIVSLVGALGFGIWAFMSRQHYKNDTDKISADAVSAALVEQKTKLDAEFEEKQKSPYDTYNGKPEAGSISFTYPRTWSAYIIEKQDSNPINGYFQPGFVPDTIGNGTSFALRLEVVDSSYDEVMKQFEGFIKQNTVKVAPYTFAKVPGSLGSIITGKIIQGKDKIDGTMIIMPLRDKTIKLWTESNSAFLKDFNEAVLPSLTYIP